MSRRVHAFCLLSLFSLLVACAPAPQVTPTTPASPAAAATTARDSATQETKPVASPSPAATSAAGSPGALSVPLVSTEARRDAEDFYRGKTVHIVVGASPGGGFDSIARLAAPYLSKYIPGSPTVIVENQPGAGGGVAANAVFNTAPKDGTVLLVFSEGLLQGQYLGQEGLQFDARKFNWLGSTQSATTVCIARADSGITRFQDIQGGGKQLKVGTVAPGTSTHDFPLLLKGLLDANIELAPGYGGTSETRLAMERGETNGACLSWEPLKTGSPQWLTGPDKFVNVLVQQGAEKEPDLPGVPTAEELAQTPEQKQIVRTTTGSQAISKPFAAPPGVLADRVAVLRAAFAQMVNDPAFRSDAKKAKVELAPRSGEAVERQVNDILSVSPDLVRKIQAILAS